jgi:ketosteroid isomerase-like protein
VELQARRVTGRNRRLLRALRAPWTAILLELGVSFLVYPALAQEQSPLDVVEAFHSALVAGDSLDALSHLHPKVVIYEGGHAEDLAQYRAAHLAADMEFARSVESRPLVATVWVSNDVALVARETRSRGTFHDRSIDAIGTETMVLERTARTWRIRHIHWSSRRAE